MGTGTCSPGLDFPSVNVAGSPESVRIGRRGGGSRPCYLYLFFPLPPHSASLSLLDGQQPHGHTMQTRDAKSEGQRHQISRGVSRPVLSRPVTAR